MKRTVLSFESILEFATQFCLKPLECGELIPRLIVLAPDGVHRKMQYSIGIDLVNIEMPRSDFMSWTEKNYDIQAWSFYSYLFVVLSLTKFSEVFFPEDFF